MQRLLKSVCFIFEAKCILACKVVVQSHIKLYQGRFSRPDHSKEHTSNFDSMHNVLQAAYLLMGEETLLRNYN